MPKHRARRSILNALLALLVFGAGFLSAPALTGRPAVAMAASVYQTITTVRMYPGMSTSDRVIQKIPPAQTVKIRGVYRSGAWAKVTWSGRTGYIRTMYLKLAGASTRRADAPARSGVSQQSDGYHMFAAKTETLRRSPSAASASLATVKAGSDLLLINKKGSFYQVRTGGRYGWLPIKSVKDYARPGSKAPGAAKPAAPRKNSGLPSDGYHMIAKTAVSLRAGAGSQTKKTGSLMAGQDVLLIDAKGSWFKIYTGRQYGYVRKDALADYGTLAAQKASGRSTDNPAPAKLSAGKGLAIRPLGSYGNTDVRVSGSLPSGTTQVRVYLNGSYLGRASLSGRTFSYTIPSQVTLPGTNSLRIEAAALGGTSSRRTAFKVAKTPLIVVDAGHGGNDPGAVGRLDGKSIYEKTYAYRFAEHLARELRAKGFRVIMTRQSDYDVPRASRTSIANRQDADLLFSVHHNAGRSSVSGAMTIYPSMKNNPSSQASFSESRELADRMRSAFVSAGMAYRGSYRDIDMSGGTLYVLRNARMRTILTEIGFISNARDVKQIMDPAFQKKLAKQMAKQVHQFFYQD